MLTISIEMISDSIADKFSFGGAATYTIVLIPIYAFGGLFIGSLQSTKFFPCFNAYVKSDSPTGKELTNTHLIISLDRGMAFDDNIKQVFVAADKVIFLEQTTCK